MQNLMQKTCIWEREANSMKKDTPLLQHTYFKIVSEVKHLRQITLNLTFNGF